MSKLMFALAICSVLVAPAAAREAEQMTPMLLAVQDSPVAFRGSDGRTHLVYELWLTNFSSGEAKVEEVEVLANPGVTAVKLADLDAAAIDARLQPAGTRGSSATLAPGTQSLLFLHVVLPPGAAVPHRLGHQVTASFAAAPPGHERITFSSDPLGATGNIGPGASVDPRKVVVIGPPLRGERYISADSCCDSTRHMRAALPVNGRVRLAQRFAVDWEQLDEQNRIYAGPQTELAGYTIFGKPVLAVANARVANVIDGLPEQTPGKFPEGLPIEEADGNSVVLDLGGGSYALYAHLQPGSIKVRAGERVKKGQVLGLVGNTGNSVAPHLHFHVMDSPSPLSSNGVPYTIDAFTITGTTPGTAAFDEAEEKGTPLAVRPVEPPQKVKNGLPLDQLIIRFE